MIVEGEYLKHSKLPHAGALLQVFLSHLHPFSCAYLRHSILPLIAAFVQVSSSHAHPLSCKYCKHSKYPPCAAREDVSEVHVSLLICLRYCRYAEIYLDNVRRVIKRKNRIEKGTYIRIHEVRQCFLVFCNSHWQSHPYFYIKRILVKLHALYLSSHILYLMILYQLEQVVSGKERVAGWMKVRMCFNASTPNNKAIESER